jgi:hypothetical protein
MAADLRPRVAGVCGVPFGSTAMRRRNNCLPGDFTHNPVMSDMGIFQQLGRRTLPIPPFQQKRDAGADEDERPDPTGVDVDHAHA